LLSIFSPLLPLHLPEAIFPACYFPPVAWFVAALREEAPLLIEGQQPYRKQRLSSRAHIRVPNRVMPLTIPVERRSALVPVHQKRISYAENWPHQHWQSLRAGYANSPYFEFFATELEAFYQARPPWLIDLLLASTQLALTWLGRSSDLTITEALHPAEAYVRDYRQAFDPGAKVLPTWFEPTPYPQVFGEFHPGLSILDLLCNMGGEARAYLLDHWVAAGE
jgi:hypothetical protein